MKHLLNICNINGAEVEPVDIITFGAPCQDLSVAGKRSGLKHEVLGDNETTRSGLFFEAIRIIKEMRESTNGEYPKYAVYENVPGAFSSNKGRDFHAVLEALCSICGGTVSIPKPYDAKQADRLVWNKAGEIVGDNYSVAWRTLDAQYWGVPQRRKRIYLVADFGGQRAGEILFKPDSLRGDMSQGNEAGQEVAANALGSVDGSVGVECLNPWDCQSKRIYSPDGIYCTLPAMDCGGANNQAVILDALPFNTTQITSPQNGNNPKWGDPCHCLASTDHPPAAVIALQANGIDRADTAGCNGCGWRENESYTLNTIDRHAVCYQNNVGALQARDYKGVGNQYVCEDKLIVESLDKRGNGDGETVLFEPKSALEKNWDKANVKNALRAGASKSSHAVVQETKPPRKYIIRRLLPVECARLQGFPDWWGQLAPYDPADAEFWEDVRKTHAEINGKKYKPVKDLKKWYDKLHNDGAEYKAYGNGLALPNAEFVMRGIAEVLRNEKGQFISKGGIIEHNGYICVYKPEHPRARANGYVREHILVVEEMLNRPLNSEEVVHHINGDKTDNRPENLEVFATHAEHVKHHNHKDGKKYSYKGSEYTVAELSEFSVVDYSVLTQRINKLGWDIERAVETPKRGQPTLGSLFDGIGGFPLAGLLNGIKPLWASEVEPYAIAVTKSRFEGV